MGFFNGLIRIPLGQEKPESGDRTKGYDHQNIGDPFGERHEILKGKKSTFHTRYLRFDGSNQCDL